MTPIWNIVVVVLVLLNILACVWLLIWTSKRRPNEAAEGAETGHVWDDDLREYNNPLPRWWLNVFVFTVVFGLGYLALYPGLGNFAGKLGWSSHKQLDTKVAEFAARKAALYAPFEGREIDALKSDSTALQAGASIFENNCSGCHGVDARGAKGFPNLSDHDWLYGSAPDQVFQSITNGRRGQMPPFFGAIDAEQLTALIAFVRESHLPGANPANFKDGAAKFASTCAACHGPDAHGNPLLGAPNLMDDTWLHGGSADDVRQTILFGRKSEMPPFASLLNDTERKLVAAYVLSLSDQH